MISWLYFYWRTNDANVILTSNEKQTQLEAGSTRNHFTAETSSSLVLEFCSLMDAPKDPSTSSRIVSMIFSILLSCCAVLLLIGCVIRAKQRRALARVHFVNECPPEDAPSSDIHRRFLWQRSTAVRNCSAFISRYCKSVLSSRSLVILVVVNEEPTTPAALEEGSTSVCLSVPENKWSVRRVIIIQI